MKQTDLAWIAGFFDGEGCISITQRRGGNVFQLRLNIVQRDPQPLVRVKEILGYGRVRQKSDEGCWMYLITSNEDLEDFIQKMKPYSLVKSSQLLLAEEYLSTARGHINIPVSEDLYSKRLKLKLEMQAEKRRLK